jgi:hypothetical protein
MKGGDPTIAELKTRTLSMPGNSDVFPPSFGTAKIISLGTATMLIFKAAAAEDAYCMVYSYTCGFIIALVAMILMFLLTQASHHLFVRTWCFGDAYTYQEIWRSTFGPTFSWFPTFCIIVAYLNASVTGFWEVQSFISHFVNNTFPNAPELISDPWLLQYVMLIIFCLPCFFVDRISWFGWSAWLGFISTIVATACLGVHAFRLHFDGKRLIPDHEIPLATWEFYLDYGILSSFNVAFFAHPFVAPIAKEMERPTRNRILATTWIANLLWCVCLYLIPAFGYLAVEPPDDGENIYHSLDPTAKEVIIGEAAVIVNMVCSSLVFTFFLAKTIIELIMPIAVNRGIPVGVAAIGASALSICVNFWGDFGAELFLGIGEVAFAIIGFVLPPVYYFAQYQFKSIRWGVIAIVVLLIGGGIMIVSLVITIQNAMEY